MAIVKFINGIDELHGAIDSVKEGQKRRARLVCRWRPQGPQSYDADGSKLHELFYMRFPEGPRSEGYQRNFNMILAAQRMAHDIERVCYHPEEFGEEDLEQARIWQQKYAEYRATFSPERKDYKHFYGWMYTEIYRGMRELGS
jgi:hypothetical protein